MKLKSIVFAALAMFSTAASFAEEIAGPAGRFIRVGGSIDQLGDVDTTGKEDGSCLSWSEAEENWLPAPCGTGGSGGGTASNVRVFVGPTQISSPTAVIYLSSAIFTGSLSSPATAVIGINSSSVTIQGNTFNVGNRLLKLDTAGLVPNALIDSSSVTKLGSSIALGTETTGSYVRSVVGGDGITVSDLGTNSWGLTMTPTTLAGDQTWSNGVATPVTWTWDVTGLDPRLQFSDDLVRSFSPFEAPTLTATDGYIDDFSADTISSDLVTVSTVNFDGFTNIYRLPTSNEVFHEDEVGIGSAQAIHLWDANNSNYVGIKSSAGVASNQEYIWPDEDGDPGDVLTTDGNGILSFGAGGVGGWSPGSGDLNLSGYSLTNSSSVTTLNLYSDYRFLYGSSETIRGIKYVRASSDTIGSGLKLLTYVASGDTMTESVTDIITDGMQRGTTDFITGGKTFGSSVTIAGSLFDGNLSAGTSGYVFTSRGASLTPQWLPSTGGGGAGTPDGDSGTFQGNNAGSFGAITAATYNYTTNGVTFSSGHTHVNVGTVTYNNVNVKISGTGKLIFPDNTEQTTAGGGGGVGTPGGSTTTIQYNNNGSLGGVASATYTATTGLFTISSAVTFVNLTTATYRDMNLVMSGTSKLYDSSLSPGTSGYVWTSRGATLGGQWLPASGGGGSGDIEGVTAGVGLTGGGTSGTVGINLSPSSTNYIQNSTTFQGATAFISSATVNQQLSVVGNVAVGSVTAASALHFRKANDSTIIRVDSEGTEFTPSTKILSLYGQNFSEPLQLKGSVDFDNYANGLISRLAFKDGVGKYIASMDFDNETPGGYGLTLNSTGTIKFYDVDNTHYVALKASPTVATSVTWLLPAADGTNGQALTTNGNGTLAFSSISGGAGDIESVSVSAPLTGGGSTGGVSIDIDRSSFTLLGSGIDDSEITDTLTIGASGSVNDAALPSGITRDTEWDSGAEINSVTTDFDFASTTHTHTGSTLSGVDISDDTNLAGTANEITLTDDTLSAHSALTRDTEWDTIAEIEAVTGVDILTSGEGGGGGWSGAATTDLDMNDKAITEVSSITYNAGGANWTVFGETHVVTTNDYQLNSGSNTFLSVQVIANSTYSFSFSTIHTGSALSVAGMKYAIDVPNDAVYMRFSGCGPGNSASAARCDAGATGDGTLTSNALSNYASAANNKHTFEGTLVTGASGGAFNVQFVPLSAGMTVRQGSVLHMYKH